MKKFNEDHVESYIVEIVDRLENIGIKLGDNEYDIFSEITMNYFEPYFNSERNYN